MKPLLLGIYGKSNSGKTSLMTELISYLKKNNKKIACIKISDKEINIDEKGKDTWKYAEFGSDLIVFKSKKETDFIIKQNLKIEKIIEIIGTYFDYDLILIEGARGKSIQKIRIGDIEKRENTVLDYKGDFESLIKMFDRYMEV